MSSDHLHGRVEKQAQLPFVRAFEIAWKNIRVRLLRSLLVRTMWPTSEVCCFSLSCGGACFARCWPGRSSMPNRLGCWFITIAAVP